MAHAEYQLSKFNTIAIANQEHADVERMAKQVEQINARSGLDAELPGNSKKGKLYRIARLPEFKKGKRDDHDRLPEEIQALYIENLSIMQQMRAIHAQLVVITNAAQSKDYCPDGDRYPLVKEIIALDEKYRSNWLLYDQAPQA